MATSRTLTDAVVVLGAIDPPDFAGDIRLDREAARRAIQTHLADPLGLGVEEAAMGAISVACAHMRQAIRALTIERGFDIREFSLLAFGGAGSIFASFMEPELDMRELLVPPRPGVFAALGLLLSNVHHNNQESYASPLDRVSPSHLASRLEALASRAGRHAWRRTGSPSIGDHSASGRICATLASFMTSPWTSLLQRRVVVESERCRRVVPRPS